MNERKRDQALSAASVLAAEAADLQRRTEHAVARALHWGATWRHIADALGVTPQAAHKRYRRIRYDPATRTVWHEPPLPL